MKRKVAVIGGFLRERIVADMLLKDGFSVSMYATEQSQNKNESCVDDCLKNASALILPVRSNREDLQIEGSSELCPISITEERLHKMKKGAPIYCGIASSNLRQICIDTGHPLNEVMECDKVAIPNAILTAEGTLFEIIKHSDRSLRDIIVVVFGYGRVGKACAELFSAVGCKLVVFCRNDEDIRHGRENGFDMRYYSGCASVLSKTDYLINTVPSLIVDKTVIPYFNKDGIIFDLASFPGGVDLELAKKNGIISRMLPGIPGKYAPITAGKILGSYYIDELKSLFGGEFLCV